MTNDSRALTVAPSSDVATIPRQQFTPAQVKLLRDTLMPEATHDEMMVMVGSCVHSGLDPFAYPRQIHAIQLWNDTHKCYRWTPCPSIDGLRLIAARSDEYEGQTKPEWCAEDGVWRDIWLSDDPPAAARVGVWRRGFREPTYGVAKWKSFRKTYKDKKTGEKRLKPTWEELPDHMLAIRAEAIALKKAFPNETIRFRVTVVEGKPLELSEQEEMIEPDYREVKPPPTKEQVKQINDELFGEDTWMDDANGATESATPAATTEAAPGPPAETPAPAKAEPETLTVRGFYARLVEQLTEMGHAEMIVPVSKKSGTDADYQKAVMTMRRVMADLKQSA